MDGQVNKDCVVDFKNNDLLRISKRVKLNFLKLF